jgi:very-short-patch-repair endonuclease
LRGKDQKRAERARSLRRARTRRIDGVDTHSRSPPRRLQIRAPRADRSLTPSLTLPRLRGRVREGVCRKRRLIIELHGGQHAESLEDRHRDRALRALGYRVIRIWNNDVIENLDGVLQNLLSELDK